MILNQKQVKKLVDIADSLEEHIRLGEPYNLTFYYDNKEPLTLDQKKRLEEYQAHKFRDIWGRSWIKGEANKIREFVGKYRKTDEDVETIKKHLDAVMDIVNEQEN